MTSMYDNPPNSGHWPGAQRRRAAADPHRDCTHYSDGDAACARARARDGIDPVLTPMPAGAATAHDVDQLDSAGRLRLHTIAERAAVDPAAIGQRVHVARTRRGIIVMLTVYTLDASGDPVTVLGVPEVRHVIRPVTVAELPEAWRRPGDR